MSAMDAYQSLSSRVASMEELLRRSESTVAMVLQRMKGIEEYVMASEGRHRSEGTARSDSLALRVDRVAETCNTRVEAINSELQRQGATVRLLEESVKSFIGTIEQKVKNDISTCYQRVQTAETSLGSAIRNLEAGVRSQLDCLRSSDQSIQGEISSMQHNFSGELLHIRQRVEKVEVSFRSALDELRGVFSSDIVKLADSFKAQLQSYNQSSSTTLASLDQKIQEGLNALQGTLAREISTDRQTIGSVDTSLRDGIHSLHSTVNADIATLSNRLQVEEVASRAMQQQVLAELSSHRQQLEVMDTNWRASLTDLASKLQEECQNLRSKQSVIENTFQRSLGLTNGRMEEVAGELRLTADNIERTVQMKLASIEATRDDIARVKCALATEHDERRRLQEEMRNFSVLAERSVVQLQAVMEATVRATHSDLLERLRPLTTYRSEMHAAVTAALNKLWCEIRGTFTSQREFQAIQSQIEVLDNAVRKEVALLAEKGRLLERRAATKGEQSVSVVPANTGAECGSLVPFDAAGELNTVWNELRDLQRRLGTSKEEMVALIGHTRQELLSSTLDIVRDSGEEFRGALTNIRTGIHDLIPRIKEALTSARDAGANDSTRGRSFNPKKTVIRLLRKGLEDSAKAHEGTTYVLPVEREQITQSLQGQSQAVQKQSLPALHSVSKDVERCDACDRNVAASNRVTAIPDAASRSGAEGTSPNTKAPPFLPGAALNGSGKARSSVSVLSEAGLRSPVPREAIAGLSPAAQRIVGRSPPPTVYGNMLVGGSERPGGKAAGRGVPNAISSFDGAASVPASGGDPPYNPVAGDARTPIKSLPPLVREGATASSALPHSHPH